MSEEREDGSTMPDDCEERSKGSIESKTIERALLRRSGQRARRRITADAAAAAGRSRVPQSARGRRAVCVRQGAGASGEACVSEDVAGRGQ